MNKRIKKKKLEKSKAEFIAEVCISKELKEDSIAHKIKKYFELGTIQQKMLFEKDKKTGKVLVSKKAIIYLLSLCNDIEQLNNYDMEIVESINPIKK